jgi:hypothetical protein
MSCSGGHLGFQIDIQKEKLGKGLSNDQFGFSQFISFRNVIFSNLQPPELCSM